MSDYAIIGKKGTGKTVTACAIIQQYLKEGRRVAGNINLYLDKLLPPNSKMTYTRISDHPTIIELEMLGRGQLGVVEEENGAIFLDECSHFFNARTYQDKDRQQILDWLTESRKLGWDVYYLMQGLPQLDKQIRETQLEYIVNMKNTGKWPIPLITPLTALLFGDKRALRFPKGQLAITRQGTDRDALIVKRRWYRSTEFYPAYETQQRFKPRNHPDATAPHTLLSNHFVIGRHLKPSQPVLERLSIIPKIAVYIACRVTSYPVPLVTGYGVQTPCRPSRLAPDQLIRVVDTRVLVIPFARPVDALWRPISVNLIKQELNQLYDEVKRCGREAPAL